MKKAAAGLLFSMKRTCGAWRMKYGFAIWSLAASRRKPVVRVTSYERKRVLHGSEAAASYLRGKYFINKQGLYVNWQPPGCFFQWSAPAVHEKWSMASPYEVWRRYAESLDFSRFSALLFLSGVFVFLLGFFTVNLPFYLGCGLPIPWKSCESN